MRELEQGRRSASAAMHNSKLLPLDSHLLFVGGVIMMRDRFEGENLLRAGLRPTDSREEETISDRVMWDRLEMLDRPVLSEICGDVRKLI